MLKPMCFVFVMMMVLLGGAQVVAQEDALVLYFTCEENAGDIVGDQSGNGNDGTLNGAEWGDGKFGTALKFDPAVKAFVEVADSPTLNPEKEISYMAWIYSEAYDNARGIISKYTGSGNQRSYNLRLHHTINGAISTEVSSNGVYQLNVSTTDVHSEAVLQDGSWHHAAISFKAEDFLRMYIDGELVSESAATATESIFDNETPMSIGTDFNDEDTRFFNGMIDEVAVFNRALSNDEVKRAMEGNIMNVPTSVEAVGKLATSWGMIKE